METRRGGGQGIQGGQGDRGTGEWGDRGKGTREIEGLGETGGKCSICPRPWFLGFLRFLGHERRRDAQLQGIAKKIWPNRFYIQLNDNYMGSIE